MLKLLQHTRRPDITFYRNGQILIAATVVRQLSLQPGDSLNIAVRSIDNAVEYLLYSIRFDRSFGRREASCHPTKKDSRNYRAYSVRLCRAILTSLPTVPSEATRASFIVGEPVTIGATVHLPIITRQTI